MRIRSKKSLGQNFLIDREVLEKIISTTDIVNKDILDQNFNNLTASIITPDKDIIPNAENLSPAYIVFENYEIILQWNRSLRFSLAVCTLKDKFSNEL